MQALLARLRPGDGALDIGANLGHVTGALAAAVGPSGHVLAIEPHPGAAASCAHAMARQPWVTVREMAADAQAGSVVVYLGHEAVHSSVAAANVPDLEREVTVAADTLDAFAEAVPHLKAIKIDAQGAECRILAGAAGCLNRPDVVWMVELWPAGLRACGSSVAAFIEAFASRGLQVIAMGKQLTEPGRSWDSLAAFVDHWTGTSHTNLLIGRGV